MQSNVYSQCNGHKSTAVPQLAQQQLCHTEQRQREVCRFSERPDVVAAAARTAAATTAAATTAAAGKAHSVQVIAYYMQRARTRNQCSYTSRYVPGTPTLVA